MPDFIWLMNHRIRKGRKGENGLRKSKLLSKRGLFSWCAMHLDRSLRIVVIECSKTGRD
jgi:hypothetical protein